MDAFFAGLLVFVPVAIGASFWGVSPGIVFFLAAIAIVPLSKFIGESTEEIATRTSPALGGLLSATFGNATELIIGLFALNAGLIEVVKASVTGSIISNLLLVLGFAMYLGGRREKAQIFNKTAALASGSTLFIGVIALVVPAIFAQSGGAADAVENLSVLVACTLLLVYAANLVFSLHTHKHLYMEEAGKYEPRWSLVRALATLFASTVAVAWISDILVNSITPIVQLFGWSQLFIGVIFLAIIGNAAEHFSAVSVAIKNRMDLSLQVSIGSATQMAMFVAPVLVLAGLLLGQHMNLVFNVLELAAIVFSVIIVNFVIADGESNWLEGVQLLAAYAIIGIAFFFHG